MTHPVHLDWLRRLRECLRAGDMAQLEARVHQAGLDLILDADFLHLARQVDARQVVVLIATLGAANANEPSAHERLLAAYQCLQGQLPVEEAASRCAAAARGSEAFYRGLLECVTSRTPSPMRPGMPAKAGDLMFAIDLLADAGRTGFITPLLRAWQAIDRSARPWLYVCRELASRARYVRTATEAEQLALATQERLQDAPAGQHAVRQELRIQLMNMALKCRRSELALQAASDAFAHGPDAKMRFGIAQALMMKGDMAQAMEHVDVLLRELAQHPEPQAMEQKQEHHSFDVAAAEDTLRTINRLLRNAGLRPFLMSGTLLGYAREGALLPHDKDIDLGLLGWEDQFTVAQALIQAGHFDVDLSQLTGKNRFLMTANDLRNGMAVDFFFFHDRGDHLLHGIDFDHGFTQNFRFSRFELKEVDFLGERFFVPDDVDTNLSENYGDWRTPAKRYVVTVESPALSDDNPFTRQLLVHLELMKTIHHQLGALRARRILGYVDALALPGLSPLTRAAVDAWLHRQDQQAAQAEPQLTPA